LKFFAQALDAPATVYLRFVARRSFFSAASFKTPARRWRYGDPNRAARKDVKAWAGVNPAPTKAKDASETLALRRPKPRGAKRRKSMGGGEPRPYKG